MNSRIATFLSMIAFMLSAPFSSRVSMEFNNSLPAVTRLLSSDNSGITLQFSAPNYSLESVAQAGQDFQKLVVPNAEISTDVGKPQLPVVSALVGVPAGVQVDLLILQDDAQSLSLDFSLPPALEREAGASPLGPAVSTEITSTSQAPQNSATLAPDFLTTGPYPAAVEKVKPMTFSG